ncbi:helix-turn-helix domain-containing protein [Solibacillus sp. FSL H8-0523]|uniref:PucR family transcriptional regulator n=1 Tax=Solibacillus sp. FSL H8-0523 TaxID=2954511 RepID=UPI003100D6CF
MAYSTSKRITYFQDIEIHTVFKNKSTLAVEKFVAKLAQLSDKLLHTLEVFFDCNLQLNSCANAMQIHRHTLKYRLNQITELTGYNPVNFEDAFTLKVALILKNQK